MKYKFAPAMVNNNQTKWYDYFVDAFFVGKNLQNKTLSLITLEKKSKSKAPFC